MRKNSIKNTRINMEVQRELSEIIRTQVKDPGLQDVMVSVTDVEVSPDLKYCKAYISVLGSQDRRKAVMDGLKRAVGFIRRELAHRVNLRNTPEIIFLSDQSIEYGVHMTRMIDDVTRDLHDREEQEKEPEELEEELEEPEEELEELEEQEKELKELEEQRDQEETGEATDDQTGRTD